MHYFFFKVAQYVYKGLPIEKDTYNALLGVCNFLLHFKPDLSIKDNRGLTVYHLATCNAKLFHVLIKHSPPNFHGDEHGLLLEMSEFFNTSFLVRNSLENHDDQFYGSPTPTVHTLFSQTPYCDEGVANWVIRQIIMQKDEHQTLLSRIMHQNMLCSYQKEKIDEMQEKATTVVSFLEDISEEVSNSDILMAFTPQVSGSCIDGTKVESPDEMDVLCVLHNLRNLLCIDGDVKEFVEIKPALNGTLLNKSVTLPPGNVSMRFYQCIVKALRNTVVWKKYPKLAYAQEDCDVFTLS